MISFGHCSEDAVGHGFSSTPGFNQWGSSPAVFTSRPSIDFFDAAEKATVGESADESQKSLEATAAKVKATIDAKQKEVESKFASPIDSNTLYQLTDKAWQDVTTMAKTSKSMSSDFDPEKKEVEAAAVRLLELRAMAKLLRDKPETVIDHLKAPLAPESEWSNEFKKYITFPYTFTKKAIDKSVGSRGKIVTVIDMPSGILTYIGQQARKGIEEATGIPEWVIPVAIGGLAISLLLGGIANAKTIAMGRP
jgi:hypothetical protein